MGDPIRVVIVDDQKLVRAGIAMILAAEDDIAVVGQAGDGADALALIRQSEPDVALMDVRMPVMDGIAATTRVVLDRELTTKVLILTTFDTDEAVLAAMRAGASGFLLKDAEPDDIVRAIRAVAGGDAVVAPSAMRKLLVGLGPQLRGEQASSALQPEDVAPAPAPARATTLSPATAAALRSLTQRETEVLALVGEGLNNAEIGQRLVVAEATAKTHVSRIMGKLGARDRVQAVIIAYQAGLVG